jgi:hypothetical protein
LENGEIVDIVSMQGSDSLLRSTLTIRAAEQSDNGVYTCLFISDTGKTSLKTFDLLVTVPSPIKAVGDFLNQRGITAVIGVMAALIILMAIATALSYTSAFTCKRREESCAKSPSELMGGHHSDPFVLGTDNPNRISPTSSPV